MGPYKLQSVLDEGGSGTIHVAERDGRLFALKTLVLSTPTMAARFRRKVETMQSIQHPNVCPIVDHGEEGGYAWLVMPLLDGHSLARYIDTLAPLSPDLAASITQQILRGLGAVHAAGIVHRDLNPSNIQITGDGTVKLLDFGIARTLHGETITPPRTPLATLSFVAPEQLLEARSVTFATDLFNVGLMFYMMLTGRHPYQTRAEEEAFYRHRQILHPLQVSPPLDAWADRLLRYEPEERFQTAEAALEALTEARLQISNTI